MTAVLTQIYCIANQFLTQYVQTGNRTIDNHIIVLIPMIIAAIVDFICVIYNQHVLQYIWYRYIRPVNYGFDTTAVLYRSFVISPECDYKLPFEHRQSKTFETLSSSIADFVNKCFPHQNEIAIDYNKSEINQLSLKKKKGNNFANKTGKVTLFPIWYSKIYKEFVFLYNEYHDQEWLRSYVRMFSNNRKAIDEFLSYIESYENNKSEFDPNSLGIYKHEVNSFLYQDGLLNPKRTFDQLFFDQKSQCIELLQRFKNGNLYPSHFGMDNKLGILLYGPPGTGKTSFITCVANYLQRNIALINLSRIKSQQDLNRILDSKQNHRYVYVFEELDCIPEVVRIRDGNVDVDIKSKIKEIEQNYFQMISQCKDSAQQTSLFDKMKQEVQDAKMCINLSYLLQKLDGIESANNRLIIATTNHPEFIDPALLRPGRFDLKLNLGNCSNTMLQQILNYYFETTISEENIPSCLDRKFAPVDVINICMTCTDAQQVLDKLLIDVKN